LPKKFQELGSNGPKAVGKEAKRLLIWLESNFELDAARPLVDEMLHLAKRLADVRRHIRKTGLEVDGKPNPFLSIEDRLSAQFLKLWRTAGLADREAEDKLPVGRPPAGEGRVRWGA